MNSDDEVPDESASDDPFSFIVGWPGVLAKYVAGKNYGQH